MHHVFDETPNETVKADHIATTSESHAIYDTHVGKVVSSSDHQEQVDVSQYRYVDL
jgi:hypothetical protein